MPLPVGRSRVIPIALVAAVLALLPDLYPSVRAASTAPREIRGLWVLRTSLTSPAAVRRMIEVANENGFNAVMVQVRGRGDAYFDSTHEPRAEALPAMPPFDPLGEVVRTARHYNIQVHAWVNVALVSSAVDLPSSREHIVHRHPEWLMVPRPLAPEMSQVDPTSPAYVGRLARWSRSNNTDVEGLYVSPLHPDAAHHTVSVVSELVSRYDLDGVHLDYVRYPTAEFDYSPGALAEFRAEIDPKLVPADRLRLASEAVNDPFAFVDAYPAEWARFRRSRLTSLVMRLRSAVRQHRPNAIFSAAVVPDPEEASRQRLQDWRTWLDGGFLDVICPMAYTSDPQLFAEQIEIANDAAGPSRVWAGIGAFRLPHSQTVQHIQAARRLGTAGILLFSYDSLTAHDQRPDYLAQVARAAFDLTGRSSAGAR
jgi:uncharacterized lipoprotein YddW (UPF0748 family)